MTSRVEITFAQPQQQEAPAASSRGFCVAFDSLSARAGRHSTGAGTPPVIFSPSIARCCTL
jgi:hypothetical protein